MLQELPGRLWAGKEAVLDALAAVSMAAPADVPAEAVVPALITAAGRKNASFRKSALAALEVAIDSLPGDHLRVAGPVLLDGISAHASGSPSRSSTPAKEVSASSKYMTSEEEFMIWGATTCESQFAVNRENPYPSIDSLQGCLVGQEMHPYFPWELFISRG